MGTMRLPTPEHVATAERLLRAKRLLARLYALTVRCAPLGFADDADVRLMGEVAKALDTDAPK